MIIVQDVDIRVFLCFFENASARKRSAKSANTSADGNVDEGRRVNLFISSNNEDSVRSNLVGIFLYLILCI